jgi:type 1 glutamine amidotransferase
LTSHRRAIGDNGLNLRKFFFLYLVLSLTCKASSFGPAHAPRANETKAVERSTVKGTRLRALFVTGGLWHKYKKLAPYLTNKLALRDNVGFQTVFGLDVWKNRNFADGFDVVVYDLCFDDVDDALLDNALAAGRAGKPTIFIHCAVHSFRNSKKVHEWEDYIGLRSKFHDKFGPFETTRMDASSPILQGFPDLWKTRGDELYQTIEVVPDSHPLLRATSPKDGRTHIVAWTHTYGSARVFATTLGHDKTTAHSPEYQQLLANALLWVCGGEPDKRVQ